MKKFPLALSSALMFVCISGVPAQAGEIFGSVGYGRFARHRAETSFGPTYGAGIGAHPLPLLGFEFTVHGMRHFRGESESGAQFEGTPLFLSGNVLLHLSGGLIQPYLVGGLGVMHYTGSSQFLRMPGVTTVDTSRTEFAMNFGGGMKIFVVPKVSLRPEIRFFNSRPRSFNMMQASIGLSLHW